MVEYNQAVEQLVNRVVETVHPLRIILFGSGARQEDDRQRDIDLLVVMPNGTHRRQTSQLLYRRIRQLGVPFDIVVATPKDLDVHKDNVGLIYRRVLQEGVEVYAS
jgi:predicted nucleotidyltransferase